MTRGRPPKLKKNDKFQIYARHISGIPIWRLAQEFGCGERTVYDALAWARKQIPLFSEKENLVDGICAIRSLIRDLHLRKRQLVGEIDYRLKAVGDHGEESRQEIEENQRTRKPNWNAYVGIMKELRECYTLLHKLQGILKAQVELGDDTIKGLHDIVAGKWKPQLPDDIPEAARQAITGKARKTDNDIRNTSSL